MTDTTKRLAKALRNVMTIGFADECMDDEANAKCDEADAALADFDRTAAQEANVQGGVECPSCKGSGSTEIQTGMGENLASHDIDCPRCKGTGEIAAPHPTPAPDEITQQELDDCRAVEARYEAGLPPRKKRITPNAPAPASGEVFNILLGMRARLSNYRDDGSVSREAGFWLMQEIGTALTIEAATRARQGEAGTVAAQGDTARLDYLDYRNARKNERNGTRYGWRLEENHNRIALEDHNFPVLSVREAIDAAMKADKLYIPTAAPVPADEGEKK